jgi:hypothetical protein
MGKTINDERPVMFCCVTCTYLGNAGNLKYLHNEGQRIFNYLNNEMQHAELVAKGKQEIRYTNPMRSMQPEILNQRDTGNLNYLPRGSVGDPDRFGPDPDPTSENRPDPDLDSSK